MADHHLPEHVTSGEALIRLVEIVEDEGLIDHGPQLVLRHHPDQALLVGAMPTPMHSYLAWLRKSSMKSIAGWSGPAVNAPTADT